MQALAEQSRLVRLPSNKITALSKINQAISSIEQKFEREPTNAELAELLNISVEEVRTTIRSSVKQVSMDAPFSETEGNSLLDVLVNHDANEVNDKLMYSDSLKAEIGRLLSNLNVREREVIKFFFGIDQASTMSLGDIGEMLHLSRERVRQIKDRALNKLATHPSVQLLVPYLG